ncbi:MAG: hypothetical protein J5699_05005 [Bacteroidales bacterium]|nr:hypothetical protein [Bacteroidales bacterium]
MSLRHNIKQRYLRFTEFKWIVGVAEFDSGLVLDPRKKPRIHWIKSDVKGSWFADPFILSETGDHINLLVEEYEYAKRKARISKLVVNRHDWNLEQIVPVIEIPTHLSFPAYYRENGKVYIYPESTKSGKLTLYEYDEESGRTTPVREISDCPLADATLWNSDGKQYILATTAPKDNGKVLDFYPVTDTPSKSPESQYSFKSYTARNAGLPFDIEGRTIRPAQDCTGRYGSCVVLQEVKRDNGRIRFEEVKRLYSPLLRYNLAFHTFNVFENRLVAVDAQGFRNGWPAQIAYYFRELFR